MKPTTSRKSKPPTAPVQAPAPRAPARYKITRTETVVRQEEAEVVIRLIPRPLLREMLEQGWTEEDVARTTREAQEQLDAGRLTICVHGDEGSLYIQDACISQFFSADYDVRGEWKYNGREVNVVDTHYERRMEVL